MPTTDILKNISDALDVLCEAIGDNLPEDWELSLEFRKGELSIILSDPETGEEVELCDDDLGAEQMVVMRVDHARRMDGLEPTGILEFET